MRTFVIRNGLKIDDRNQPSSFVVHQNYPNPFTRRTTFTLPLPTMGRAGESVELKVF